MEEQVTWRKEQLAREIASLEGRKASMLAQLNNLRALADQSASDFATDDTMVIDAVES